LWASNSYSLNETKIIMVPNDNQPVTRVAIIGFGEVGPIFAHALTTCGIHVHAYDIKIHDQATRAIIEERARLSAAQVAHDLPSAVLGAQLIFSAVTASQAHEVANACAPIIESGQIFIDLNSVSPAVKQRNRQVLESGGAHYIEAAVMAPVPPQGIRVPMLLGGHLAHQVSTTLNNLGMKTQAVALEVGLASAIKLCRSIMIKGMEALCVQSMLAAHSFNVDERVLASLAASFPGVGWDSGYEAYLIGRVVEHGKRRSEEMQEAALMLESIGMSGALAKAVADVQENLAKQAAPLVPEIDARGSLPNWRNVLGEPT
jgi:3-hydroxyisobutyrate dehydrogenase-like beta-hydroxyacid dehydrogenase